MRLTFLGIKGAADELDGVAQRLKDWTPIEDSIHDMLIFRAKELFDSAGASEGVPWPGYESGEPRYRKLKDALVKKGIIDDASLLRFKGSKERLYPSFTRRSHPEHIFALKGQNILFGSRVPYAWVHDQGGGRNMFGEPIPIRRLTAMSDRNVERLMQLIYIYVVKGQPT